MSYYNVDIPPYTRMNLNPVKKNLLRTPNKANLLQLSHSGNIPWKASSSGTSRSGQKVRETIPVNNEFVGRGRKKKGSSGTSRSRVKRGGNFLSDIYYARPAKGISDGLHIQGMSDERLRQLGGFAWPRGHSNIVYPERIGGRKVRTVRGQGIVDDVLNLGKKGLVAIRDNLQGRIKDTLSNIWENRKKDLFGKGRSRKRKTKR